MPVAAPFFRARMRAPPPPRLPGLPGPAAARPHRAGRAGCDAARRRAPRGGVAVDRSAARVRAAGAVRRRRGLPPGHPARRAYPGRAGHRPGASAQRVGRARRGAGRLGRQRAHDVRHGPPRPARAAACRRRGQSLVVLACVAAALPVVQTMRYATVQADLVETLFTDNRTATAPRGHQRGGPVGRPRAGQHPAPRRRRRGQSRRRPHRLGDAAHHRHPDRTGGHVQPAAQHDVRPVPRGQPAARRVPGRLHRRRRRRQRHAQRGLRPGAGAGTRASSATRTTRAPTPSSRRSRAASGVAVDYYVLVNLLGFQQVVDAMGGVTVNVNEPVAINGDTDRGIPPDRLPRARPGPAPRRLPRAVVQPADAGAPTTTSGCCASAAWSTPSSTRPTRSPCSAATWTSPRPARRSCAPTSRGRCCRPSSTSGSRSRSTGSGSVAFVSSDRFFSGDPDYAWMQESVRRALATPGNSRPSGGATPSTTPRHCPASTPAAPATSSATVAAEPDPGESVDVRDSCEYQPVT